MLDHSYTMINELRRHIDLVPYILAKGKTPELEEYCSKLNVKFIRRLSFKNPLSLIKEFKFFRALKKQKPDVVWFNRTTFYQTLLVRLFFKRFIINVHDVVLHPEEKDKHGIITQKLIFRFLRKHIAVMSNTQKEIFSKQYNEEPHMLQLPIIDYYREVSPAVTYKRTDDKIRFFFFGSVMPYKGIEKLIEASKLLGKKYNNFEINIFGKINYNKDELLAKISADNNLKLVNKFVDYKDISSIYASNDIIIIPYIQVSQCGPLLIGYAQNVPVICSNLPGFVEYVDDDKSGLIFDNTAESLAEKMEQFILNRSLIAEVKNNIAGSTHEKFSMAALAKDYIKAFKNAASI